MLEERRAELPVRQQYAHRRIGIAKRPEHAEVGFPYIVGHNFVALGELRYDPGHKVNRLELVSYAGRSSEIVFEDNVAAVTHVYEVYAIDVNEHVARRTEALHLWVEVLRREHHVVRNDVLPVIVEVDEESVDRPDTLLDSVRDHPPLVGGNDARYPVCGRGSVPLGVQIEGECVEIDVLLGG